MSKHIHEKFIMLFQSKIESTCSNQDDLLKYVTILININEEDPEIISEELKSFILELINTIFEQANKPQGEEEAPKI